MKNCPFCNAEVADDVRFCPQCGADLENAQEAPVEEMPVQETPVEESHAEETAYTEEQSQPEVHEEPVPEAPAKKKSPVGAIIAIILIIAILCGGYFLYKYLTTTPYDRIEQAMVNVTSKKSSESDVKVSLGMQGISFDIKAKIDTEYNDGLNKVKMDVVLPQVLAGYLGGTNYTIIVNEENDKVYVSVYSADNPDEVMTAYQDLSEDSMLKDFDIMKVKKFSDYADIIIDFIDEQLDEDEKLENYFDVDKLRSAVKTVLTAKNMENYCTIEVEKDEYHLVLSANKLAKYALDTVRPAVKADKLAEYDEAYEELKDLEENDMTVDFVFHIEKNLIKDMTIKAETEEMSIIATIEMSGFGETKVEIPSSVTDSYKDAKPMGQGFDGVAGIID